MSTNAKSYAGRPAVLLAAGLLAMLLFGAVVPSYTFTADAQAQIVTRREKIGDFTVKTLKVVLSGDEQRDVALSRGIRNSWSISPYEVCAEAEFEKLRTNPKYYFMYQEIVASKDGDPGIVWLHVSKGTEGAKKASDLYEVCAFPLCGADSVSTRDAAFMPAIFDILQSHIENSMLSGGKSVHTQPIRRASKLDVFFTDDDLCAEVEPDWLQARTAKRVYVITSEKAEEMLLNGTMPALMGHCISPKRPTKESLCYNLLVDVRTHELYYYEKRKCGKQGRGFTRGAVQHAASR